MGTIQSKNYPNVYADNSNCTWRIVVQPHRKIKVDVKAIDIPAGAEGQCTGDYLQVRYFYNDNFNIHVVKTCSGVILYM